MIRLCSSPALVSILLLLAAGPGCQKKTPATAPTNATAANNPATPEDSFTLIIETFKRSVEDVPIGFIVHDESGRQTMMTGRNEVSHELIKPAKEGDPYKAKIIVKSHSRYSLQQSTTPSTNSDQSTDNSANADDSGVQVFDPNVVSQPNAAPQPKFDKNAVPVAQKEEKHERTYELVYENGRWKLITKLDPKTEGSIQLAFDRAIDSQS